VTRILILVNILISLALIPAYLAPYADPGKSSILAFWGLAYPIILFINLLFLLFWLVLWKRYFLISLIFILIGWNYFQKHFNVNLGTQEETVGKGIKIISYNVQNLAKNNLHIQDKEHRMEIFRFLLSESPDILCMQEFYYYGKDTVPLLNDLKDQLHLHYISRKNYYPWHHKIHALVTLSAYPILESGYLTGEKERVFALFSDLLIGKDTVRLYNVHLESIRFGEEDFRFVSELTKQAPENTELREGSRSIFDKLGQAFARRAFQARKLSEHIRQSRYPVIVCGDFNDTPGSFSYNKVAGELTDAFCETGRGYGNTYGGNLPPIRIDYILLDPEFDIQSFKVHKVIDLSDHFPVSAIISLP